MPFQNRFLSLTLPPGAGPGETRIVIGPDLPPPLDTYLFDDGSGDQVKATAGIIYYSGTISNDDYHFMVSVQHVNHHDIVYGAVLNGAVIETLANIPEQWAFLFTGGSGFYRTYSTTHHHQEMTPTGGDPAHRFSLRSGSTPAGNRAIELNVNGVATPTANWLIDYDGAMQWGNGGAGGTDINLFRTAAGELSTQSIKALVSGAADNWHAMTLSSPWTNRGAGYPALSYRKVASPANSVQLVGQVAPNGAASGSTIATLPSGYRPTTNIGFECGSDFANRALLEAESGGAIKAYSSAFGGIVQINTIIPLDL